MTHTLKLILSLLATGLTLGSFYPYLRSIFKGHTQPHVFSWIIWGITTCIAFAVQLTNGGGLGAWPIGISGILTLGTAVIAYSKKVEITITRLDWVFFFASLSTLPLWYFTDNPLLAIVFLTLIDVLGFVPTIRKWLRYPESENMTTYVLILFRNFFAMGALEHYTTTTLFFPAMMSVTILCIVPVIEVKRRVLKG